MRRASGRLVRPPEWLWFLSVPAQVAAAIVASFHTYFWFDDFLFFREAQMQPLGVTYLREAIFAHFTPVSRLLMKSVVLLSNPPAFALVHAVELVIYAAVLIVFALVMRTILGGGWAAFVLTLLFGQSVFLLSLLSWWSALAGVLPASFGMLLALLGYLRWREQRSVGWLLTAWLGLVVALLDYELAMLFVVIAALIRSLILSEGLRPRDWLRGFIEEWTIWLGFVVLTVAAFLNYWLGYYAAMPSPALGEVLRSFVVSAFRAFIPGLLGYNRANHLPGAFVVGWSAAVFFALVVTVAARRPRAWRFVVVFIVVFLIETLAVALNRIGLFGVSSIVALRYDQSNQWVFFVLVAFSLTPRYGIGVTQAAPPGARREPSRTRAALPWLVCAGLAGYALLYVVSMRDLGSPAGSPEIHAARRYVENFGRSAARYTRRSGRYPDLINLEVPTSVMPSVYIPFNQYDEFFHVVDSRVTYDRWREPAFVVGDNGVLRPVRLQTIATAGPRRATVSDSAATVGVRASDSPIAACVRDGPARSLEFPMGRPRPVAGAITYEIGIRYVIAQRAPVTIFARTPTGEQLANASPNVWGPGRGAVLAALSAGLLPRRLIFDVPAGTCVSRVSIVAVVPR